MDNNIKCKTKAFISQFKLSAVTLENLKSVIQKQGYTIIEFNNIANGENVSALLTALDLQSLATQSTGFTYADLQRQLVFVREGLSEDEKLMVLAHEEGHIYCNHLASTPILGCDVIEEHEANEFAHYLLHRSVRQKVGCMVKEHKKASIAVALIIVLMVLGSIVGYKMYCENTYYKEYYITSTGNNYHEKSCGYVKGKDNIERLTIEQYESGEYEPCGVCLSSEE